MAPPNNDDGYCVVSSVMTNKGKEILTNMHIDFPTSGITAILGPSGSGKTTLLSVITDSIQSNVTASADLNLPGASAFVPQDDRLHGFYTCQKYMQHYARLAGLPSNQETSARIDKLLKQLGLKDQADTIVGDIFLKGLSGGQKRRLSVALEALTNPNNFFLDEPTSGLDAESALQVMDFLRDYTREAPGRRVVLTIHQPSSFIWTMIDHVVLLSKGKLMFQGPREEIEDFFSNAGFPTQPGWNPSDHYVTAVNDEFRNHELSVEEWSHQYLDWISRRHQPKKARSPSMRKTRGMDEVATHRSKSPLAVVAELTYRYFLNLWMNPGILGTRVAMYSMLALMVGALFWDMGNGDDLESIQSRAAVLFYCVSFFIFMSVAVLPFTMIERAIVDKEIRNKYYHPVMYQVSQGLASLPGAALLALLVSVIVVPMCALNGFGLYFLDTFLSLVVAEALAQLVSHVVPHFVIGMAGIAGLYGFFMLFQGFMLVPSNFPGWLRWTYNIAFHSYAWRTFMVNEFEGQTFEDAGMFKTGEDVLRAYEIEDVDVVQDMVVLVCYALILHVLSFVVLQFKYFYLKGKLQPVQGTVPSRPAVTDSSSKFLPPPSSNTSAGSSTQNGEAALAVKAPLYSTIINEVDV